MDQTDGSLDVGTSASVEFMCNVFDHVPVSSEFVCLRKEKTLPQRRFSLAVDCIYREWCTMYVPRDQNPALAALLTVMTAAFAAGTSLLAKALGTGALGPEMHSLQISHGRFLFAFIAISLVTMIMRPKLTRPAVGLHVGRSVFGWGGVTLMFAAASFIPLSDATAITFLNPVFGMMFAIPFLGEKVGPVRWGAALVAITGAAILTRPGAGSLQTGAILALVAAVLMGAELILIKRLAGREAPLQILLVNNAIGLVIATVAVVFVWISPSATQWLALGAIGILMALAQTCFVNAMARADASFVAPFFYSALVFATLYDVVIFGVVPDAISFVGGAIILTGAGLLVWREAHNRTHPEP